MTGPVDVLAVYSGKCLKGVCGIDTGFTDMNSKPLFTGDIVIIYTATERDGGEWLDYDPGGLTAVVSDEWTSYSDGSIVRKDGPPHFFVMGLYGVPLDSPGAWRVRKVKSFSDVVEGENWPDYGFNYRSAPAAALAKFGVAP